MFGLHSLSSSSRRGCSFRAVKITVASKMACFRSSVPSVKHRPNYERVRKERERVASNCDGFASEKFETCNDLAMEAKGPVN